jgi:predicted phage tail protein
LVIPWSERQVFSITPVIAGAGGVGRVLAGIGLIALAILVPGIGGGVAATVFGTAFSSVSLAIGSVGFSLVLGGVAQLISPQQTYSSTERGKDAARFESFTFSGITNTAQQGLPVPICYGRAFIGSAVISSGLDVDQLI